MTFAYDPHDPRNQVLEEMQQRIRELEAECEKWNAEAGKVFAAYGKLEAELRAVREQYAQTDAEQGAEIRRLRLAIERAPCGWADSDPVGTLYGVICDNCDCWKRAALNTEKGDAEAADENRRALEFARKDAPAFNERARRIFGENDD